MVRQRILRATLAALAMLFGMTAPVYPAVASVQSATAIRDMITPTGNYEIPCSSWDPNGPQAANSVPAVCRQAASRNELTVTYYIQRSGDRALEQPDVDAVHMAIREFYSGWVRFEEQRSPVTSGDRTDIIFQEGGMPAGHGASAGLTWCDVTHAGEEYVCDQHTIRVKGYGAYTSGQVCHEVGHALGLLHGKEWSPEIPNDHADTGCMGVPIDPFGGLTDDVTYSLEQVYGERASNPKLPTPTGLRITNRTRTSIQVSWNPVKHEAAGEYAAYRWDIRGKLDGTAEAPSATFTGLSPGVGYQVDISVRPNVEYETEWDRSDEASIIAATNP